MAVSNSLKRKQEAAQKKLTPTQLREKVAKLEEKLENSATCYLCGELKNVSHFYTSTDPMAKSGLTPVCKKCATNIACRIDANGELHEPTKESIILALSYLNKPFINDLYDSSIQEAMNENTGKTKNNAWTSYIKNVAMKQYIGKTYKDSDMFRERIVYEDEKTPEMLLEGREDQDTYVDFLKNKKDVVRLLSYDPFEKESLSDQPFLYSQLLGLLDSSEDANDDMMRTASAISIVRGFLQQQKIDDTVSKLMSDIKELQKNSATIKSLQDSKAKITGVIKDLAAESCISLKNNKNTKKGENSWTGKIKKIKDLNLREGEVNGFDLNTCKGMRQVMDASNQSILAQLRLDESEYSDMLAEMRETVVKLREQVENYKEISRILLRENIDLKDYISDNNLDLSEELVDLNELFSPFNDDGESGSDD